ncbi:hypothetical protein KIPB_013462, partial [Kipferlia bialata]
HMHISSEDVADLVRAKAKSGSGYSQSVEGEGETDQGEDLGREREIDNLREGITRGSYGPRTQKARPPHIQVDSGPLSLLVDATRDQTGLEGERDSEGPWHNQGGDAGTGVSDAFSGYTRERERDGDSASGAGQMQMPFPTSGHYSHMSLLPQTRTGDHHDLQPIMGEGEGYSTPGGSPMATQRSSLQFIKYYGYDTPGRFEVERHLEAFKGGKIQDSVTLQMKLGESNITCAVVPFRPQ